MLYGSFSENGMFDRAETPMLDQGERFVQADIPAAVLCLIDGDGGFRIQFASGEIHIFSGTGISVDVAGEKAAFCQFVCHRIPRR